MMAATRDNKFSAEDICLALIYDYLRDRDAKRGTLGQKVATYIKQDKSPARKDTCEEITKKIVSSVLDLSAADIIRYVADMGAIARKIQQEKSEESGIKSSITALAYSMGLRDRMDLVLPKTIHAIRTCLIKEKKLSHPAEYAAAVQEKIKGVEDAVTIIKRDGDKKVPSTQHTREGGEAAFNALLDMQWGETILKANGVPRCFPEHLPTKDDWGTQFQLPTGVSINSEIPIVYDENFFQIYIWNEIHSKQERYNSFMRALMLFADANKESRKKGNTEPTTTLMETLLREKAPDTSMFYKPTPLDIPDVEAIRRSTDSAAQPQPKTTASEQPQPKTTASEQPQPTAVPDSTVKILRAIPAVPDVIHHDESAVTQTNMEKEKDDSHEELPSSSSHSDDEKGIPISSIKDDYDPSPRPS